MKADLARIAVGIPVAALWPLTLPFLSRSARPVVALAFLSALYVLAPVIPDRSAMFLLALAPVVALLLWKLRDPGPSGDAPPDRTLLNPTLIAAVALGAAAAAVSDFDQARIAVENAIENDHVALVVSGLFACVFLGGSVVAWVLATFERGADDDGAAVAGFEHAGRYIGWFERAVLFAFVLAGQPQAAVIALAAKSFARFPSLQRREEGFAEYFLVGSLASLAVAVAVAVGTRGATGSSLFP